jgi:hypothetical protein
MSARSFTLDKKRQGNITVIKHDGINYIKLHETFVITHNLVNKTIYINSGGYHTNTTKTAINRYLKLIGSDARIIQDKRQWYLVSEFANIPFHDNIRINNV